MELINSSTSLLSVPRLQFLNSQQEENSRFEKEILLTSIHIYGVGHEISTRLLEVRGPGILDRSLCLRRYSHKAISSIEALLLDRCRTHANIHFHHRVVAMKLAMREAISQMLVGGNITRESLSEENLPLCDDVWLWNRIREDKELDSQLREVLLFRKKQYMRLLWKSRPTYKRVEDRLAEQAGIRQLVLNKFNRSYELHISTELSCRARVWVLGFSPVDNTAIRLSDESLATSGGENHPSTLYCLTM